MKTGLESLKEAVQKDAREGNNCFNENGCDHEFYRMVPQENKALIEMGFTTACVRVSKCGHKYCDKYKWVLDRAKHYAEKTGRTTEEILQAWESKRTYWYMNYYQECNQPLNGLSPKSTDGLKLSASQIKADIETYGFLVDGLTQDHQQSAKAELVAKVEALKSRLKETEATIAYSEIMSFGAPARNDG